MFSHRNRFRKLLIFTTTTLIFSYSSIVFAQDFSEICTTASGDCCTENSSPGCNSESCCLKVCECDPYCCEVEWDENCATTGSREGCSAASLCTGCKDTDGDGVNDVNDVCCDTPENQAVDEFGRPIGDLDDDCDVDLKDFALLQQNLSGHFESVGLCCTIIPSICDDGDLCTTDSCDSITGSCTHTSIGVCPIGKICDPTTGRCIDPCTSDVDCVDNDPCTVDTCASGICTNSPVVCQDDGLFCNGVEQCVDGKCISIGNPCLDQQICNEKLGICEYETLFVNILANGMNNGTSWENAFTDLQDALSTAVQSSLISHIWVAQGIYKPAPPDGDRTLSFNLFNNVALYGGFAGGETGLNQRNPLINVTTLSGDLNGNDTPVTCTQDSPDCDSFGKRCIDGFCIIKQNNSENSHHVVYSIGVDATAVLDGFIITGGNANGAGFLENSGGGMLIQDGSPTIVNCTFHGNSAGFSGGGMSNFLGSSPTLTNCTFIGNTSIKFGGGMDNSNNSHPTLTNCTFSGNTADEIGGGMYNFSSSSPTLSNCTFSGNSAVLSGSGMSNIISSNPTLTNCTFSRNTASNLGSGANNLGGGMYNSLNSNPTLTNCTFSENMAINGGGMYNSGSSPTLTNCTFSGNSALNVGGGMLNAASNSNPTLTNCTFSGNSASVGGGMYNNASSPTLTNCTFSGNSATNIGGGMFNFDFSSPTVANCILWGDTPDEIVDVRDSTTIVTFSDVQGGWLGSGFGNIDADPLFVDAANDNIRLLLGSPCIDAGNNTAVPADTADLDNDGDTTEPTPIDLDGNPRFVDDPSSQDCPQKGAECGTPPIVDMGAYEFSPP